jgi:hypothetical protein
VTGTIQWGLQYEQGEQGSGLIVSSAIPVNWRNHPQMAELIRLVKYNSASFHGISPTNFRRDIMGYGTEWDVSWDIIGYKIEFLIWQEII